MRASHLLLLSWIAFTSATHFALSQPSETFRPKVGQQGKDVVWVPTAEAVAETMLNIAKVTPSDYVIDLGSGDGRMVIKAAKRGAKALGIEYNADMVEVAKRNAVREGVAHKVSFVRADLFETDFSQATVLTMFLLPHINLRLRPALLEMRPGTRVVSNTFDMGDWPADRTVRVRQGCKSYCKVMLWIVPARAEGTWRMPEGELRLTQTYQSISGTLTSGNVVAEVTNGKLVGDQITFRAAGIEYVGKVRNDAIEGTRGTGVGRRAVSAGYPRPDLTARALVRARMPSIRSKVYSSRQRPCQRLRLAAKRLLLADTRRDGG